ncbi:hypothetical protein YSA_10506 [Pseudomonas putida ND6]|uniref:Uncharacterized protein n=1 Tax=Pseudomonas putida ND6 TaxID=231023 RepID=I3V3Z2_PSEPU|nr:hypothetical protein YSA_10506 [Pseudomonas putida ND6]
MLLKNYGLLQNTILANSNKTNHSDRQRYPRPLNLII